MTWSQIVNVQEGKPQDGLEVECEHFYQVTVGNKLVSNQMYRSFL
ncbi:MAG: hypothetical protein S4CHLAM2_09310 [Chlamydiales bacterium]|nr:hypothetical protein [Chlamydiales bacterium]